jgi:hypothetical protein
LSFGLVGRNKAVRSLFDFIAVVLFVLMLVSVAAPVFSCWLNAIVVPVAILAVIAIAIRLVWFYTDRY